MPFGSFQFVYVFSCVHLSFLGTICAMVLYLLHTCLNIAEPVPSVANTEPHKHTRTHIEHQFGQLHIVIRAAETVVLAKAVATAM